MQARRCGGRTKIAPRPDSLPPLPAAISSRSCVFSTMPHHRFPELVSPPGGIAAQRVPSQAELDRRSSQGRGRRDA